MQQKVLSKPFRFMEHLKHNSHTFINRNGTQYHYLALVESGRCRLTSEDRTLEIEEGEGFYLPLGLSYRSDWWGSEIRYRSVGFLHYPEAQKWMFPMQKLSLDSELIAAMRGIPLNGSPDSASIAQLYALLAKLKLESVGGGRDDLLERAGQFFSLHPTGSVPQASHYCGVSVSALYAAFRAAGKTPNELRRQILAEKAALMLTTTDRSVQSVSDSLGFSSTSYFRKVLKQYTGMTPRDLRRSGI
jgi:AraC-like DNA-binding protein